MIKKEDDLWKGILEDIFIDFIRFVHPGVDDILDLEKGVEFLDKELSQVFRSEDGRYSPKMVDKLVKVFTREGKEEWILLHIEVQANYSKDFGKRMFTYYYRLFDKYNKRISAYAIFTEPTPKSRSDTFRIAFMGTNLSYRFNTYKITDATDRELVNNDNPFALVILAARSVIKARKIKSKYERDVFVKNLKIEIIKQLYSRNMEKIKENILLDFILSYIIFEMVETKITFDNELQSLTKNTHTMGIREQIIAMAKEEGLKEGIKKGKREGKREGVKESRALLAHNLITKLAFTDQQIVELLNVSLAFVKRIRKQKTIALTI